MDNEWLHAVNDSFVNPEPIVLEESDVIINDFLSPSKLQEITKQNDLSAVTSLEMVADTRETTLGNFGQYVPNLKQLKLSDSMIPSVRDIGTSLMHLQVLWMSRCGLSDIDGIASMQNLKELYVAFNNISDVSPISFLESVEVADLEGNKIADAEQLDYLAMLTNLTTLTLSGNPICQQYQSQCKTMCSFRELVLEKMPGLQMFNDEHSLSSDSDDIRPSTAASSHSQEDIDIINTAIKEGILKNGDLTVPQYTLPSDKLSQLPNTVLHTTQNSTHVTRQRPATAGAQRSISVVSPDNRKFIPSPQTRPGSSGSEGGIFQDDSSSLTQGDVICGNPFHLARNRKKTSLSLTKVVDTEKSPLIRHRPSTSLGLRSRPMKVGTGNSTPVSQDEKVRSVMDSPEVPAYESENSESDRLSPQRTDSTPPPTTSSRQIPSPIASSGQPYKTPTPPPRSPQRPQTAGDFRAGRYRRSYSSASSSVNVMSVNAVSSRFRSSEPIRKEIEDLT